VSARRSTARLRRSTARLRRRLARLDRRLLVAATAGRTPARDATLTAASTAADHSVLWLGVAGVLAATGRRRPRSAAASGLLGIGIAATLVNGPLKFAWRRDRPPLDAVGTAAPLLPLPRTFSFPSGHAASAFAFGTGVSAALPAAAPAVLPMAGAVAYSRVHTGVHYPSDVAVGAAIGAGSGVVAARVVRRLRARAVHRPAAQPVEVPVPRHAVLLTSDRSGSADRLDAARRTLEDAGLRIDAVLPVDEAGRVAELARGADPPLVIAAGGDGTVCAAVNAVRDTDAVLAVLPLGTSNDVARSLGIPPDPCAAAAALAGGRVCAVDAAGLALDGTFDGESDGESDGDQARIFLNAATVGLNVTFARLATDHSLRDRFGGLSYPIAAARALRRYRPFECTVEHDGETRCYPAVHVSVSNAPVFGGLLGFRVPGASITDGLLDVIVVERLSLTRVALAVANNLLGRHRPVHRAHTMRVEKLRLRAADRQEIALDGEVVGTLPAEFRALPAAIRVVLPADADS
jgi:YegS/Rv2252/BmrU family lipid kinase